MKNSKSNTKKLLTKVSTPLTTQYPSLLEHLVQRFSCEAVSFPLASRCALEATFRFENKFNLYLNTTLQSAYHYCRGLLEYSPYGWNPEVESKLQELFNEAEQDAPPLPFSLPGLDPEWGRILWGVAENARAHNTDRDLSRVIAFLITMAGHCWNLVPLPKQASVLEVVDFYLSRFRSNYIPTNKIVHTSLERPETFVEKDDAQIMLLDIPVSKGLVQVDNLLMFRETLATGIKPKDIKPHSVLGAHPLGWKHTVNDKYFKSIAAVLHNAQHISTWIVTVRSQEALEFVLMEAKELDRSFRVLDKDNQEYQQQLQDQTIVLATKTRS